MDLRNKQIIDRINKQLADEGFINKPIFDQQQYGIGSAKSYFEVLIDRKLEGKDPPTSEEVWTEMKTQINWLTRKLVKASEDYSILETRIRHLEEDIRELRKGI
jgi:hypothetical protein